MKAMKAVPATAVYTPQQVLKLSANVHKALVNNDRDTLRALCAGPVLQHLHLLRPTETAMVLNHLAHLQVLDPNIWQPISDAIPALFVDPDAKSLGLTANAYARAALRHDAALNTVASLGQRLTQTGGPVEIRGAAMLVNGFSKLRVRHAGLMEGLAHSFARQATEFNEIDLATVLNGFARVGGSHDALFEALRKPTIAMMDKFSVQNLAMVANAHARLRRRDVELMGILAGKLRQRCDSGQPIAANHLPSIVHAFVARLGITTPDLVHVVEFSLPLVVGRMTRQDTVLTVPPLVGLRGLRTGPEFRKPVFAHCATIMGQLTHNAIASFVGAAARLRHDDNEFWQSALQECKKSFAKEAWEPKYVASLTSSIAEVWTTVSPPPISHDAKEDLFLGIAQKCGRAIQSCDLMLTTDLADSCLSAQVRDGMYLGMVQRRGSEFLRGVSEGTHHAPTPDAVNHLRLAMDRLNVHIASQAHPSSASSRCAAPAGLLHTWPSPA